MMYSVYTQLLTKLKDNTVGFQAEIDAVESARSVTLPDVPDANIYGLDTPVQLQSMNKPALVVTPVGTDTPDQRHQSTALRDSVHRIAFEYVSDEPDENEARQETVLMAEALMRFLDHMNANETTYVGSSGIILVSGWTANYAITWSAPPNALRGFTLEAEFLARDTF